jgi:hypothetical protein
VKVSSQISVWQLSGYCKNPGSQHRDEYLEFRMLSEKLSLEHEAVQIDEPLYPDIAASSISFFVFMSMYDIDFVNC